MGPLTILTLAAIGTAGMVAIAFFMGLSQNRLIIKEDAAVAIKNYDVTLTLDEIVISSDGLCAFANTKDNSLIFIKSMGDQLSVRRIAKADIKGKGNQIMLDFDDLGFAPIKKTFNPEALEELLAKVA